MFKKLVVYTLLGVMLLAPQIQAHPHVGTQEVEAQQLDGFGRAVMRAARDAGLSVREKTKLRMGLLVAGKRLKEQVALKLWLDKTIPDNFDAQGQYRVNAIDWDQLIDALKELIPLILELITQLIGMFGTTAMTNPDIPEIIIQPIAKPMVQPPVKVVPQIVSQPVVSQPQVIYRTITPTSTVVNPNWTGPIVYEQPTT